MTEAAVRLADEVNQKEDNGLDAAAASAVGAVALAAGLPTQTEETEPEVVEPDPVEEEPVEAFAVAEEPPAEAPTYVPFGLEDGAEGEAEFETQVAADTAEPVSETPAESATVFSFNGAASAVAESDPDAEAEVEEASSEPTLAWSTPQTASEETVETTEDAVHQAETEEFPQTAFDTPSLTAAVPENEEAADPAPDDPTTVEVSPEPVAESSQPEEAQTYSLSGIGAGCGLGALSAKSEASGIRGPSSFGGAEEEKVLIDATEDVLPEIDGKPALPAGVAPLPPAASAEAEKAPDSEAEDGDADILKPRTRFNPWD